MKINGVDVQEKLLSPVAVHSSARDGDPVTGTTSVTASRIVTIPANSLPSSCVLEVFVRSLRVGTAGTATLYIYANNSPSLTGATLMASSTSTNTRITQSIIRTMRLFSGALTTMPNAGYSDYNADTAQSSYAFNIGVANYIIFAIANTSTADSTRVVTSKITRTNDYN